MPPHFSTFSAHGTRELRDPVLLNPIDDQPPAKRLKRLFYDPEHMPTMEFVFSEYDSQKGAFAPSLSDGAPSPSFRLHSSSSQHEMSPMVEDPSPVLRQPPQYPASSLRSGLDEQRLSNQLRRCSSASGKQSEPCPSSIYPCSPISREDTLGSPLQDCEDAYAEADKGFRPPSLPSTNRSQHTYRGEKEKSSDESTPNSFESMASAAPSSLFSDATTRSTTRGRSSTWSSDVTTVGPSSLPSVPEHKGILFDRYASELKPEGELLVVQGTPSPDDDETNALDARYYVAHFSRYFSDRDWELETITDAHPRATEFPSPELSTLYEECGDSGFTRASSRLTAGLRSPPAERMHSVRKTNTCRLIAAGGDEPLTEDDGACISSGRKDGRFATMAASLRHRYVGLSYKVRLALFRTEKTMGQKLKRYKRTHNVDSQRSDGDAPYM